VEGSRRRSSDICSKVTWTGRSHTRNSGRPIGGGLVWSAVVDNLPLREKTSEIRRRLVIHSICDDGPMIMFRNDRSWAAVEGLASLIEAARQTKLSEPRGPESRHLQLVIAQDEGEPVRPGVSRRRPRLHSISWNCTLEGIWPRAAGEMRPGRGRTTGIPGAGLHGRAQGRGRKTSPLTLPRRRISCIPRRPGCPCGGGTPKLSL